MQNPAVRCGLATATRPGRTDPPSHTAGLCPWPGSSHSKAPGRSVFAPLAWGVGAVRPGRHLETVLKLHGFVTLMRSVLWCWPMYTRGLAFPRVSEQRSAPVASGAFILGAIVSRYGFVIVNPKDT